MPVVRNRQVTVLWFYPCSMEDNRGTRSTSISVFMKMFEGTKRAELIIIISGDNELFSIEYKMNLVT